MTTLKQRLNDIGIGDYNAEKIIQQFREWLQQKPPHDLETAQEFYEGLLEELNEK